MNFVILAVCASIIAVLTIIAATLHLKLYKQRQKLRDFEAEQKVLLAAKYEQMEKDIKFLARAFLAKQVELNEASLRICYLLNKADLTPTHRQHFKVFDDIATRIQDIPTHEGWKSLSKEERQHHRKVFKELEETYQSDAEEAANHIVRYGLHTTDKLKAVNNDRRATEGLIH